MEETAAQLGALLGASATPCVLFARGRVALIAGFGLFAAAELLLVVSLVSADDVVSALASPLALAALVLALPALGGLAVLFARLPEAASLALLVTAPIRLPIDMGGERSYLLVPFYAVLGAAIVAALYRHLRGREVAPLPPLLTVPTGFLVVLYAVSLIWSVDVRAGSIDLAFFLFPFAALIAVIARSPFPAWMPRALASLFVGLAILFAAIGLWQVQTRELFGLRQLEVANAYSLYFRVTSIFRDPSIYGRFLVIAIAIVLLVLFFGRLTPWLGVPVLGFLFFSLFFTYSQSSFVALFAVAFAIGILLGERRTRIVVAAAGVMLALAAAGIALNEASGSSVRDATRGRSRLIEVTATVVRDHPLYGVGVGGQPRASADESRRRTTRGSASHTTPLTVAAELGALGVVAYAGFLVSLGLLVAATIARNRSLGLGLAAVEFIIFVHALSYSGFFQDPLMWGSLALAAAASMSAFAPSHTTKPTEVRPVAVGAQASFSRTSKHRTA